MDRMGLPDCLAPYQKIAKACVFFLETLQQFELLTYLDGTICQEDSVPQAIICIL